LRHLEDLSDPCVLQALPGGHRWLQRNQRDDAVVYFRAWADLIARALPAALPAEDAAHEGACEPARELAAR
jgi:hypothetical protein